MLTQSYFTTIEYLAERAPDLNSATEFIAWAEEQCALVSFIFIKDYDEVTVDLTEAAKELQGFVEED